MRFIYILTMAVLLSQSAVAQVDTTFAVAVNTRLEINPVGRGRVSVTAWDRSEMRVVVTHPPTLRVEIQHGTGLVKIEERRPPRAALDDVDIRVSVPAGTRLEVVTRDAVVAVAGLRAGLSVNTNTGDVTVENVTGPIQLQSSGGAFTVEDVTGVAMFRTTGSITVRNFTGDLTAETVSGALDLAGIQARRVEASSHAGAVTYRGTIAPDGLYDFASIRGDVTLHIPTAVSATVTVGTVSGSFATDFPIDVDPPAGEKFTFTLGDGGARISLITYSGAIALRRVP